MTMVPQIGTAAVGKAEEEVAEDDCGEDDDGDSRKLLDLGVGDHRRAPEGDADENDSDQEVHQKCNHVSTSTSA